MTLPVVRRKQRHKPQQCFRLFAMIERERTTAGLVVLLVLGMVLVKEIQFELFSSKNQPTGLKGEVSSSSPASTTTKAVVPKAGMTARTTTPGESIHNDDDGGKNIDNKHVVHQRQQQQQQQEPAPHVEMNGQDKDKDDGKDDDKNNNNEMAESLLNLQRLSDRLELVHIPKTGGTALEMAGAHGGVPWSKCHHHETFASYALPYQMEDNNPLPTCPNFVKTQYQHMNHIVPCAEWHVPPCFFQSTTENPRSTTYYDNGSAIFAVVRNPYDRIVSEFGYRKKRKIAARNNMTRDQLELYLNDWVVRKLQYYHTSMPRGQNFTCHNASASREYFISDCHLIPQHHYVFGGRGGGGGGAATASPTTFPHLERTNPTRSRGRPMIHHILFFERLEQDFARLMKLYNLTQIHLPEKPKAARRLKFNTRMLNETSRFWIQQVYQEDFVLFGYEL